MGQIMYTEVDFKVIRLHENNQNSFNLIENPEFYQKIKYIDVKHHFIKEHVVNKTVNFHYVASTGIAADDLIKPLTVVNHVKFVKFLKIRIIEVN